MGNAASAQQYDTTALLPTDLFELTDRQLKVLWNDHPLAMHEIQQAGRSLKPISSPQQKQQQRGVDDEGQPYLLSGLHYFEDAGTEESPESALAVRLCRLLNDLALLRFRLVPTRLKEEFFWVAALMLLKERLVEYNAARYDDTNADDDDDGDEEEEEEMEAAKANNNQQQKTTACKSNGSASTGTLDLAARQSQVQKNQIAKLKKQVQELQKQLAVASATPKKSASNNSISNSQSNNTSPKATTNRNKKATPIHKGSWAMDADSQEFLKYPDEVKESLRSEKQRRLQQVHKEMKFILDSDAVHHSNGKWDCCGEPTYHASCSM